MLFLPKDLPVDQGGDEGGEEGGGAGEGYAGRVACLGRKLTRSNEERKEEQWECLPGKSCQKLTSKGCHPVKRSIWERDFHLGEQRCQEWTDGSKQEGLHLKILAPEII